MGQILDSIRYYGIGEKLHTDICIWCGSEEKLSESHLIQESLGVKFFTKTTCVPCNNFLGAKVESKALRNNFIAAASVKLGLKSRREAYRHGKKIDVATGAEMIITKEGKSKPIPKKISENQFRGTPEEGKTYWVAQLKKDKPDLPTEPLEEFFDDPTKTAFSYAGKKYYKKTYKDDVGQIRIDMAKYIDPILIFKIAYEFIVLNGWHTHPMIRATLKQLFSVTKMQQKSLMFFSNAIDALTVNNMDSYFRTYDSLEDIPFGKYHAIIPRLSDRFIFYIDIVLFGVLRNCFILGKLDEFEERIIPLTNTGYVFPIGGANPYMETYPNFKFKDHIIWGDVSVETRLWEIEEHRKTFNILN